MTPTTIKYLVKHPNLRKTPKIFAIIILIPTWDKFPRYTFFMKIMVHPYDETTQFH